MMSNIEQFGKYLLLEKIAVGGMAEVYLAKSSGANGLSKFVAVKRILPQFSNNDEFIEMFKEEAKVAINLNNSNVVSIYDFGVERLQFYIVMEYVEGRNLRQILNELKKANKGISIEQAVFIVKEAAAGLDHAHRCTDSKTGKPLNITHRDMSPQNIMISFEGEAKVIDFGIAKAEKESEATKAGTLKGKFAYMSPEQAEGMPIDPRTDVFALGIILWELLANDRLFTGSNEAAILRKVRDCHVPPIRKINPLVPAELERIVMKALAKDKNIRYQTAANMQKDLNRFLNTQFPDFSTHDFSAFMKDCFKVAYAEGREKLVQYAKIENTIETLTASEAGNAPPSSKDILNNNAQLNSQLNSEQPLPHTEPKEAPAMPKGLSSDQQAKISLDGIRNMGLSSQKVNSSLKQATKPVGAGANYDLGQSTRVTHVTHMTKFSKTGSKSNYKKSNDSDLLMKFVVVGILGIASFWGYKNFIANAPNVAQKVKPVEKVQVSEMASQAKVNVSLKSYPSGAKIYTDGEDTGRTTPAILAVTANKDIKITLLKESYSPYETTKQFSQTSTFEATLQLQEIGGYVNIYVINGGARPTLFINGQRLSEIPPIKRYRVPANKDLVIRAENMITQLSDEIQLKVRQDQVADVELILGRTQGNQKK